MPNKPNVSTNNGTGRGATSSPTNSISTNNGAGKGVASSPIKGSSQQLIKASLISKIDPVNPIQFMFNPTDLQFSRTIDIQAQNGALTSKGLPKVVFGHVAPYELSLSGLVFDTFEKGTTVIK